MKCALPLAFLVVLAGCDSVGTIETADVPTATALAPTANASDNAATVINSGRDGLTCTLNAFGGGSGSATLVVTGSGNTLFRCAGTLNDPAAAPDRAERISGGGPNGTTCDVTVTPSGRFSGVCN